MQFLILKMCNFFFQAFFPNIPKTWSEPAVDYNRLKEKTDRIESSDFMSENFNYRSLLLEIGTYSQNELDQVDERLPNLINNEKSYRAKARQWLQVNFSILSIIQEILFLSNFFVLLFYLQFPTDSNI
jgi:DNA polymerase III delta prime subunit